MRKEQIWRSFISFEAMLGLCLIFALGLHLAPVGIIGLFLMVFLTAFKGITEEHQLGGAFKVLTLHLTTCDLFCGCCCNQ